MFIGCILETKFKERKRTLLFLLLNFIRAFFQPKLWKIFFTKLSFLIQTFLITKFILSFLASKKLPNNFRLKSHTEKKLFYLNMDEKMMEELHQKFSHPILSNTIHKQCDQIGQFSTN